MSTSKNSILISLLPVVGQLTAEHGQISPARKKILEQLSEFVSNKLIADEPARLTFICTHNSRRSHLAQIWAQTAAWYYNLPGVMCFSGGTEATAFNPRAVKAMRDAGFQVEMKGDGDNPVYEVRFARDASPVVAFSKRHDDGSNPPSDFAAMMTCSHADENCPVIPGATVRIVLTYDDPKDFDGTPHEDGGYAQRVREIGREMLYAFSRVR